jgi:putative copper export protein
LWQAVLFGHLVAMAFFLGGQLLLAIAVVPVERGAPDRTRLRTMARRFGIGSLVALAVLIATGAALASHLDLWGSDTMRLKLTLVGGVALLTLLHLEYPRVHALQALIFALTLAIVWLGLDLAGN